MLINLHTSCTLLPAMITECSHGNRDHGLQSLKYFLTGLDGKGLLTISLHGLALAYFCDLHGEPTCHCLALYPFVLHSPFRVPQYFPFPQQALSCLPSSVFLQHSVHTSNSTLLLVSLLYIHPVSCELLILLGLESCPEIVNTHQMFT